MLQPLFVLAQRHVGDGARDASVTVLELVILNVKFKACPPTSSRPFVGGSPSSTSRRGTGNLKPTSKPENSIPWVRAYAKPTPLGSPQSLNHYASPEFWASYRALPVEVRSLADRSFALLCSNPRSRAMSLKVSSQDNPAYRGAGIANTSVRACAPHAGYEAVTRLSPPLQAQETRADVRASVRAAEPGGALAVCG